MKKGKAVRSAEEWRRGGVGSGTGTGDDVCAWWFWPLLCLCK